VIHEYSVSLVLLLVIGTQHGLDKSTYLKGSDTQPSRGHGQFVRVLGVDEVSE
jgi:hypothetical protein